MDPPKGEDDIFFPLFSAIFSKIVENFNVHSKHPKKFKVQPNFFFTKVEKKKKPLANSMKRIVLKVFCLCFFETGYVHSTVEERPGGSGEQGGREGGADPKTFDVE